MPPVDFKGGYNRRKVSKPLCLVGLADHLADGFPELTRFSSLPFSVILSRRRFDGAQCPLRLLSLIDGDSASILEMQPRSIPPTDRYRTRTGRIVQALSHSPYWRDTVIFVVEHDAQAGPDYTDSHRAPFYTISAYNRSGTVHRFINTTDVIAAIEDILGMGRLSKFDYFSRSLADIFAPAPDLTPYDPIIPTQDLSISAQPKPATGSSATPSPSSTAGSQNLKKIDRAALQAMVGDAV